MELKKRTANIGEVARSHVSRMPAIVGRLDRSVASQTGVRAHPQHSNRIPTTVQRGRLSCQRRQVDSAMCALGGAHFSSGRTFANQAHRLNGRVVCADSTRYNKGAAHCINSSGKEKCPWSVQYRRWRTRCRRRCCPFADCGCPHRRIHRRIDGALNSFGIISHLIRHRVRVVRAHQRRRREGRSVSE